MRMIRLRSFLKVMAFTAAVGVGQVFAAEGQWHNMLHGSDWRGHWESTGNWSMKDGVITLTPREGEKGWERWTAYLWSKDKYDDFEVMFDYKVEARGNSGFYFNVADKNDPVRQGIEVQIYDSHGQERLTDHTSGGIIPGVPPKKNTAKKAPEWNTFHITVKGKQVTVRLNGEVVNEVSLDHERLKDRPESGFIGFQDHGLPLSLRNIKVRKL